MEEYLLLLPLVVLLVSLSTCPYPSFPIFLSSHIYLPHVSHARCDILHLSFFLYPSSIINIQSAMSIYLLSSTNTVIASRSIQKTQKTKEEKLKEIKKKYLQAEGGRSALLHGFPASRVDIQSNSVDSSYILTRKNRKKKNNRHDKLFGVQPTA